MIEGFVTIFVHELEVLLRDCLHITQRSARFRAYNMRTEGITLSPTHSHTHTRPLTLTLHLTLTPSLHTSPFTPLIHTSYSHLLLTPLTFTPHTSHLCTHACTHITHTHACIHARHITFTHLHVTSYTHTLSPQCQIGCGNPTLVGLVARAVPVCGVGFRCVVPRHPG